MHRTCIAVADASRARLFTFDRIADGGELREELEERRDLVNPARRLRTSELFSDSRPGVGRSGNLQYGFDDHREEHVEQMDAAFARVIVEELERMVRETGAEHLILCASPNMLGDLRGAAARLRRGALAIDELPRDLVKLTPSALRTQLADYGVLPPAPPRPGLAPRA